MLRQTLLRARFSAGRARFAAAAALAGGATALALQQQRTSSVAQASAAAQPALPEFTRAEVAKHASPDDCWVLLDGKIYDITPFIKNHPGGVEKILLAAGQSVEPFWALYRQHLAAPPATPKEHVAEILGPLCVGRLSAAEAEADRLATAARSPDDPFRDEPARHPALRQLSSAPCSAEAPPALLDGSFLTPNALFFVRNHHPVPHLDGATYALSVGGVGVAGGPPLTLDELKALPRTTVVATVQCGGNRRGELNAVRKTSGNAWGCGAISTAEWTGVRLRDVFAARGLGSADAAAAAGVRHVQFEGDDGVKASVPVEKALSSHGDVLLAYEMNGEPLPADHGYPLRAVVPGHVGVRNVKWLKSVTAAADEADGVWQRGIAYKSFGPAVTTLDGLDVAAAPPMQETPVTSVILRPAAGALPAEAGATSLEVSGIAYSGGGRAIIRVDVSADGGRTWTAAELGDGADQPLSKAWAWTLWTADVPLPPPKEGGGPNVDAELVCRAVDASFNMQPASVADTWNLRGLANNAWHRVAVSVPPASDDDDA